jgi:hypothetical protein
MTMTETMTDLLTEAPALMLECCTDEYYRYDLKTPFTEGAYLSATDGRWLTRQPAEDFDPEFLARLMTKRGKLPKCLEVWDSYPAGGEPFALPEVDITCKACGGKERVACEECLGSRESSEIVGVYIGPVRIQASYIARLARHGITEIVVVDEKSPVRFSLGRIEGIVMPMNPETK